MQKFLKPLGYIVCFCLMFCSFRFGLFMFSPDLHAIWNNYQKDSESLVIGAIVENSSGLRQDSKLNLFYIQPSKTQTDSSVDLAYSLLSQLSPQNAEIETDDVIVTPYSSQYGLQGIIFSKLYLDLNFSLESLYTLTSAIFALGLMILYSQYTSIFTNFKYFPFFCFFISAISPWTSCIARNLYWVPVTWILPSIIALIIWKTKNPFVQVLLFLSLTIAVTIKSLCGYEFLSFIFLLSVAPFCYLFFLRACDRKKILRFIFLILLFEFIGFCVAIIIHAASRADSIFAGLQSIWELDVKRRTFGEASLFGLQYKASLEASVFEVVWKYFGFLPYMFLIVSSCFLMIATYIKSKATCIKHLVLLSFVFLVPPLSWYILAKGHSYIHTHINFVLMDFGFVSSLLFSMAVCVSLLLNKNYLAIKNGR